MKSIRTLPIGTPSAVRSASARCGTLLAASLAVTGLLVMPTGAAGEGAEGASPKADDRPDALHGAADARIRRDIREMLVQRPDIAVVDLEVVVQAAVVTLRGRVATPAEKHLARRAVEGITGVVGVVNALNVQPGLKQDPARSSRAEQ